MASTSSAVPQDSPAARRYNRIRRWLGIGEFLLMLAFLVALLVSGASGWLRDVAYSGPHAGGDQQGV